MKEYTYFSDEGVAPMRLDILRACSYSCDSNKISNVSVESDRFFEKNARFFHEIVECIVTSSI